jgi:hypothetical protein
VLQLKRNVTMLEPRALSRLAAAALVAFPALSFASPVVRKANFDPNAGPSQYEVHFPVELGGATIIMPITGGTFEIETDAEAGTARLLTWSQQVDPIEIFGKSTGPITVAMDTAQPTDGTYSAPEKAFSVNATFLITFDDAELREFGFFSPLPLKGTEKGNIYGAGSIGTISMYLQGQGSVGPGSFNYTCQTSARFEYLLAPNQAQPGDVNHDRSIDLSDPVSILGALFFGTSMPCESAAEVNGDGNVDLSDAVFLLNYLFQGGPDAPAEPVSCPQG